MKRLSFFIVALLTGAAFVATASHASAQGRARGRFYSKADVDRIIKRVETRSDSFKDVVDRRLDRSVLDDSRQEDRINEHVKELERALDRLRSKFDRSDGWRETRSEVSDVMREAEDVNSILRRHRRRLGQHIEREWALLRRDLNTLAGVYELPHLRA